MTEKYDFDLFVIGAGSGGVRAARIASGLGAKVGICENHRVGGTCVIRGCIPKKLLVYAGDFAEHFEDAKGYGWSVGETQFSWPTLIANKDREISRLEGLYRQTLRNAGVDIMEGRGVIKDPHTVAVDHRRFTARHILVATGGWPNLPDIPGIEHAITSNEALDLGELPGRILIAGGGYIALEFAGIFHALGVETHVIYRRDTILRGFDMDLRRRLQQAMMDKGVKFTFGTVIDSIEKTDNGLSVSFKNGDGCETDQAMFAIGRNPNTKNIGLREAGVDLTDNGAVKVDDYSCTNVDSIHAVGDVTDRIALTPVAIKEGHALALTLFGDERVAPEHDCVPSAVFTNPPLASVGLTEDEARDKHGEIRVYESGFKPLRNTLAGREERAFAKLVVDDGTDCIVGAHMIGHDAPEILQGISIAVRFGLKKADFDRTVAIHPSSAEEFVLMREPRGD